MRRRCDGTDENLVMIVIKATGKRVEDLHEISTLQRDAVDEKPCDCGLVFDDVRREVYYPHRPV